MEKQQELSKFIESNNKASEWKECHWGDIATLEYGKSLRDYKNKDGKYPVYGTNGQIGWCENPLVNQQGVIIGRKGAYRGVHYSNDPFFVIDTAFYLKPKNKEFIDIKFAYYELLTHDINSLDSGSAIPSTSREDFYSLPIKLPPIDEQKVIVDILSSIDEKINLNRQMNSTLEQIAQTLFKRWFIDFEFPDENGNPYKSSSGRMIDSELGEIPEGWRVGNILDFADLLSGGTPKTSISEYWDGGIPWVSAKDVTSSNGTFILTTEKTITQKGIEKSNAKLLPEYTTVVTARGTVGNVCVLSKEMAINQTNYGLKSKYDHGDFFLFITLLNLIQDMKQNAYGTVFDTITTKTFRQIQITLPPIKLIESFEDIVGNLMHKVQSNLEESQKLGYIRDSLLPKLMSGKIRVLN